jgi:hypothetical protein
MNIPPRAGRVSGRATPSAESFRRRGLIDPGYCRLEGFVGLLGDRDADHAAQPMQPRATPNRARQRRMAKGRPLAQQEQY